MKRKSYVIYADYEMYFNELSGDDCKKVMTAFFEYAREGKEPKLDGMAKIVFLTMKNNLDRDNEKYEKVCMQRSECGKKGGIASGKSRKKKAKESEDEANTHSVKQNKPYPCSASLHEANACFPNQNEANEADNDKDNVNDNVNDNENDNVNVNENDNVNVNETDNHTDNCQLSTVNCQLKSSASAPESMPSSHSSSFSSHEKENRSETVDSGQWTVRVSGAGYPIQWTVGSGQWTVRVSGAGYPIQWTVDSGQWTVRMSRPAEQKQQRRITGNAPRITVNCQLSTVNCQMSTVN